MSQLTDPPSPEPDSQEDGELSRITPPTLTISNWVKAPATRLQRGNITHSLLSFSFSPIRPKIIVNIQHFALWEHVAWRPEQKPRVLLSAPRPSNPVEPFKPIKNWGLLSTFALREVYSPL